jgi:hypothetical protein
MRTIRDTQRPVTLRAGGRDRWRRLAIEAGMLAFLVGLALVFVTSAPH